MKIRLLILSLLVSVPAFAWQPQTGDIIFQISRSSQSKAIQLATHSDYSHTGMLVMRNKKPYVFEAVGPVKYTPLKQWIAHGEGMQKRFAQQLAVGRVTQVVHLTTRAFIGEDF